jgi:hypothetical protein
VARLEWDIIDENLWFSEFDGRAISMSLCIEQTPNGKFSASFCPLTESTYEKLDDFDNLKLAKKALEQYAIDEDCSLPRRR